ncbi:MAG: glycosyltransferase, partial [Mycobacteriaceae bacterium]|nr:glycosyltransferase [Mycobacteriaceae bacterium]
MAGLPCGVDCAAVIPCYNESATIGPLVTAVAVQVTRVLVVDDGSTDATAAMAKAGGAEVLRQPVNSGKGAALQLGLRRACELGCDWALLLDGDLRHPNSHMALELDLRTGFPELLRGEISAGEAVQPTAIEGLFAVTGGSCDYAAITALSR